MTANNPPSTEPDQPAGNLHLIRRLLGLAWRYKLGSLAVILLEILLLAMTLSGLGLVGLGLDTMGHAIGVLDAAPEWPFDWSPPEGWTTLQLMLILATGVFVIAVLRFILEHLVTVQKSLLVQQIIVDLRSEVYNKIQRLSFQFFSKHPSGSIINRVTGDVQSVRRFIDGVLIEVMLMVLTLTFFLVYMLQIHVWLTIACLATTPALWVITGVFSRRVKPAYRENRRLFDNTVSVLSENVQGVHVIKGFWTQNQETEKFRNANHKVLTQKEWIFSQVGFFVPLISFIPQLNLVVLLGFGGYLFAQGEIAFGAGLVVFSKLLEQFSGQVGNIAQVANAMQQSLTGAQRVFEVLDEPVDIQSQPDATPLPRPKGLIHFEDVSYRYSPDAEPVLNQINLIAEPGATVAIVGATGSGKSTLLSLIPRFYDPTAGQITLDGHDLRDLDLDHLRRSIGVVFQESFLFSTTVAENIAFGHPTATNEQIIRAAQVAQADTFINELDNDYRTILAESGSNLSGGQRQRLAIARAVLLDPAILILDDPTSAIDPETEHEILSAMHRAMEGRTTFIVAHRLSTLKQADLVVVLDKGRIVQCGTHQELMSQDGHYYEAANLQLVDDESRRLLATAPQTTESGDA
ncbi:ABC transporter ATP-binding protein [Mucisphaera sp.]|uniref:ABC transporter ATP-binding protein n=1 Tax=Mucisphaera sp. TaxID=2913024 RepID=UPI003D136A2F